MVTKNQAEAAALISGVRQRDVMRTVASVKIDYDSPTPREELARADQEAASRLLTLAGLSPDITADEIEQMIKAAEAACGEDDEHQRGQIAIACIAFYKR